MLRHHMSSGKKVVSVSQLNSRGWPRGVTAITLDPESSDRGSNPRETCVSAGGCLCVLGPLLRDQVVCCNCKCYRGPCCTNWLSAAAGARFRGFSLHGLQDRHLVLWRAKACHSSLAEAATLPPRPPGIETMVRLPDRIHVLWRVMACLSSLAAAATLPPMRPGIGALV